MSDIDLPMYNSVGVPFTSFGWFCFIPWILGLHRVGVSYI